MKRRDPLKSLPFAGAAVALPVAANAVEPDMTAQERFDHHLAELKKAAQEIDPMIGHWHSSGVNSDMECCVVITAFRRSGQYEGDGLYEGGNETALGRRLHYDVSLRPEKIDGYRMFQVNSVGGMDRMVLTEPRFETFIGRKLA